MTLEKLQIIIEAYTKPYRDELEKVKKQTTATTVHVEQQTSRMASSFKKIAGVVAEALSITAIVAFGKSCIDLGSQLAEVDNVIQQAVPSMEGRIDSFAKNAIQQFGMSEIAAKRYTGVFASMARGFKFSEESAASMGITLTGLAADVASFYDTSQAEAFTKLKSIFTGESETLKDLGIVMTQTALDAYALENGYGKTIKAMSEAEKVALRYAFVQEKLRFAQGDFARTSGSWANQVRILSEQFNALKATIGQGLINAFTPVIQVINLVLAKLQTLASYFKAFTSALFGNAGGGGDVSDAMENAAGASGTVADNLGNAAKSAKKLKEYTLGIDELNVLNPDDGDGGDGTGGAGVGGVPDFGNFSGELFSDVTVNPAVEEAAQRLKEALDAIKIAADPTREALKRLWDEGFAKLGDFIWTGLKDFYHEFLVPLGKWTLGTGIPMFADAVNNFLLRVNWPAINDALRNFWRALEPFAEKVGEGLLKFFNDLLDVGASFINTIIPGGLNGIASALKKIDPDQAEAIGYGLGVIATSIAAFKVTKDILNFFDKLKGVVLAAGGASTFGITLTLSLIAATGVSWAAALELLDRYENGTPEARAEIEGEWNKNKNDSVQKNKWGMGSRYAQQSSATDAYLNDNAYKKQFESIKHWIEEGKKIRLQEGKDLFEWLDGLNKNAQTKWNDFKTWWGNTGISSWWEKDVSPWFTVEKWSGLFDNMKTSLKKKWDETVSVWTGDIQNWWNNNVSPWFTLEKWNTVYSNIKTSLKTTWDNTVSQWSGDISKWWGENVSPWFTADKWSDLYKTIKQELEKTWDQTTGEWATNISNWWNKNVLPWFTIQKWSDLYETIKTQLRQKWNDTSEEWRTNLSEWWTNDVSPWFTLKKWLDLYDSVKTSLKTKWDETLMNWKTDLSNWWNNDVSPWFTLEQWMKMMNKVPEAFGEIFKGAVNAAREQLNKLIDWVNDKFHISFGGIELGDIEIPGFDFQLITIPHIPAFSTGGFPEDGLFFANHNELVGGFKGRTAVANNDQITEGIKQAVIEGMIEVMSQYSGNEENVVIETHVDMDGRTIVKQSDKVARRGGFNFRNPSPART